MDTDAVLLEIKEQLGNIDGRLDGMGREIGEIKDSLKCTGENCASCRKEIDGKIAAIQTTHTGEAAVKSWKDKTLGEVATSIGAGAGLVALIAWLVRGIVTGAWF